MTAFRVGDLAVDLVTRNYGRVSEIEAGTGRIKLMNPHYPIGWRDESDLEGPYHQNAHPIKEEKK